MRKSILSVLAIMVVCGAIALVPFDAMAGGGRKGVPVVVKNFPDSISVDNIPSSISVNNFPASITVDNMPEVIEVPVGTAPEKTFFQFSESRVSEVTSGDSVTFFSTGVSSDPVPAGKRLVVEHFSYRAMSEGIVDTPLCGARVLDDFDTVVFHPLVLTESIFRDEVVYTVSTPIKMYADAGTIVGIFCSIRSNANVVQTLGYSGYLVDVE